MTKEEKIKDYIKYHWGTPVKFNDIIKDIDGYARVFAEGSPGLERCLKNCWSHGIPTISSCSGLKTIPDKCENNIDWDQRFTLAAKSKNGEYVTMSNGYILFDYGMMAKSGEFKKTLNEFTKTNSIKTKERILRTSDKNVALTLIVTNPSTNSQSREKFFNNLNQAITNFCQVANLDTVYECSDAVHNEPSFQFINIKQEKIKSVYSILRDNDIPLQYDNNGNIYIKVKDMKRSEAILSLNQITTNANKMEIDLDKKLDTLNKNNITNKADSENQTKFVIQTNDR